MASALKGIGASEGANMTVHFGGALHLPQLISWSAVGPASPSSLGGSLEKGDIAGGPQNVFKLGIPTMHWFATGLRNICRESRVVRETCSWSPVNRRRLDSTKSKGTEPVIAEARTWHLVPI
jgi:hypothetical protein